MKPLLYEKSGTLCTFSRPSAELSSTREWPLHFGMISV